MNDLLWRRIRLVDNYHMYVCVEYILGFGNAKMTSIINQDDVGFFLFSFFLKKLTKQKSLRALYNCFV